MLKVSKGFGFGVLCGVKTFFEILKNFGSVYEFVSRSFV